MEPGGGGLGTGSRWGVFYKHEKLGGYLSTEGSDRLRGGVEASRGGGRSRLARPRFRVEGEQSAVDRRRNTCLWTQEGRSREWVWVLGRLWVH